MLTKTKKIVKKLKINILNKEKKNGLEIWRIGSFPQNWPGPTQRHELTDGQKDACATTVALLTKSSRGKETS